MQLQCGTNGDDFCLQQANKYTRARYGRKLQTQTECYTYTCRPLVQVHLFSRINSLRVFIPYSTEFHSYAWLNLPLLTQFHPALPTLFIPPIRGMGSIHSQPPPLPRFPLYLLRHAYSSDSFSSSCLPPRPCYPVFTAQ